MKLFHLVTAIIPYVLIPSLWLAVLLTQQDIGIDFYPLYFAAHHIWDGLSPYGAQATNDLVQVWHTPFASAGIAYPLPLLELVIPFTVLPFAGAAALWTLLGTIGVLGSVRLTGQSRSAILLPFLFIPVFRSISLGQATLVWFALDVLCVFAIRQRRSWLIGCACALLLLKPQNGGLFAVAGIVWGVFKDRRVLIWFGLMLSCLSGFAWFLTPDWFPAWMEQVRIYNTIVQPQTILPWGLVLVLVASRQPWWSWVAACQVVLFPLSDFYSTLPLLLCWFGVGGWLALIGSGLSWMWSVGRFPNTVDVLWGLVLWPLVLAMVWRSWGEPFLCRIRASLASTG
jgi:Glycosyltransferase family 87